MAESPVSGLRPRLEEVQMTEEAVRDVFARLHSRRIVGKCVVRVADDPPVSTAC